MRVVVMAAGAAAMACACATGPVPVSPTQAIQSAPPPCALLAFDGATGEVIPWSEVLDRVASTRAVFVGETHDDAAAHAVEHALVDSFLGANPGAAVSLEFLERDDQPATDKYLRGELTLEEFIDQTKSRDWAGKDSWIPWYQPMIDSAKRSHGRVIAANAPRKYVSRARTEGYEPLRSLPAEELVLFEIDGEITRDDDWKRLKELMTQMHQDRASAGEAGPSEPSDEAVDQIHRSQRMWDRTMGISAARAFASGSAVIHIVGGFHIGQRLGTAAQFAKACSPGKILLISLEPSGARTLEPAAASGADIVIHTHALRE